MSAEKTPLDQALDLFVYAPFGLFLTVTEELPRLVDKGRERLTSQVTMAKMMGQMAAPALQGEAQKAVKGVVDRLAPPPPRPARPAAPSRPAPPAGHNGSTAAEAPAPRASHAPGGAAPEGAAVGTAGPVATAPVPSPPAGSLAIPGYDTLSAMQVVQRLSGLSRDELEAVRRYELAHRGRKTITNRAEQLLAEASG